MQSQHRSNRQSEDIEIGDDVDDDRYYGNDELVGTKWHVLTLWCVAFDYIGDRDSPICCCESYAKEHTEINTVLESLIYVEKAEIEQQDRYFDAQCGGRSNNCARAHFLNAY